MKFAIFHEEKNIYSKIVELKAILNVIMQYFTPFDADNFLLYKRTGRPYQAIRHHTSDQRILIKNFLNTQHLS